ncbi:glycosyltransferase [Candidatus Saccharibacteria bacterium]|nr:glycosyltransferase [Candidatus Saccharibacteria bacterium]
MARKMKVAIVCDWLTNVGGAEKVLLEIHHLFPKAPIYTSKYSPRKITWFRDADVRTGWLQIFPGFMRRILGVLRVRWFSRLDLTEYDLVISVTGAEAKCVRRLKPGAKHISYCHVPTQYYWQLYDTYIKNPGFGIFNPVVRFFFKLLVKPLRKADFEAAQHVDEFITISDYAKSLISKYYKREATVIHPPVEVEAFKYKDGEAKDYYMVTSRQVNWKRLDLAVRACRELKKELLVVGEGPEHARLVKIASNSEFVKFLPLLGREELADLLAEAKGYIFPSMEPFGIAPVEALSAGCPVIAFSEGGALDYINNGKNGILFDKQTTGALKDAILKFEKKKFDRKEVSESAREFSVSRFDREMKEFVDEKAV